VEGSELVGRSSDCRKLWRWDHLLVRDDEGISSYASRSEDADDEPVARVWSVLPTMVTPGGRRMEWGGDRLGSSRAVHFFGCPMGDLLARSRHSGWQ